MTIGFRSIQYINRIRQIAGKFGFEMAMPRHYRDVDVIALIPKDDQFPMYSRDAEIFVGTLSECECFLTGLQFSRDYDRMLRLSDEKKRQRKEQDHRNEQLVRILKRDRANESDKSEQ